ncbi:M20/M25/M40 family metallo-hydrolase [Mucilaginibacter aquatilis]|uniref:M20/M25/M40 family metallo-hydrolase n=1 Tax=Mucilaginibacter aquatilis TaxID=1517760 RepID=A0A6I4IR49_9SPHI|nr:M20/M25/M40 family metallo-hydrolase [Mucilaginibacter aquatilis]MVN92204.1 M20/M25/M40 family metallo-hydrolase [Mucilaginibacter aquatilis]
MRKYVAAIALLAAGFSSYAQDINKLIDETDVQRLIKTLSADEMQGRGTFTPGIDKAATFIEAEFKKAGLQPLTGEKGFRQNFTVYRTAPVESSATIEGQSIDAQNVAVYAGSSFNWDNNADVEVARIDADKNFRTEYRTYLRGNKKTLVLVDQAHKDLFNQLRQRFNSGSISMSKPAEASAQQVVMVLGSFGEVKNFKASYKTEVQNPPIFNVAGMIPGKSKKDEYVVFSGHYDHLGILPAMQGDSIANGADDDASGTTAMISLAKYFNKLKNNERTLIFVAFTAEEIGGYGARYFSQQLNPDKVVAMFNIEMIGKESKFGKNTAFITGYERSDFGKILQSNLQGTAFTFHPDPYPAQDLFYRSDNATLARLGVPAHTISTDQIDTDKLYHSVKDEYSSLDVKNITATIHAIALSSRSIVAGKDTPTRIPKLDR